MTDKPQKASDVQVPDNRTDEQRKRDEVRSALAARRARRAALTRIGVVAPASGDLADRLERGLAERDKAQMAKFRKEQGR